MAANMLAAYYARSENTEELFQNLVFCKDVSYKEKSESIRCDQNKYAGIFEYGRNDGRHARNA